MEKRAIFNSKLFPYFFLAPQLLISFAFFFWPALIAIWQSFQEEDAFGLNTEFVWFDNYIEIFKDSNYITAIIVTIIFSISVTAICLIFSLFLAGLANKIKAGKIFYQTLIICPYAVAPAIAGVLWFFLFSPSIGYLANILIKNDIHWNPSLNGNHALILIILSASWKQISYNFLFYLASLQSIPKSLLEAASIDGASPLRRFFDIIIPMISPTTFFLFIMNMIYTFFDTFGIIYTTTHGGPGYSTTNLVYKVYVDGIVNLNLGSSSAQSVILMIFVSFITILHFRFVEKKVHY
ncbi:sn-glycerol-3-phosphate ABC transporter permease UgpA [Fluviispira multicolorata]|uniref:sn-glycerol-3-phosphate transport system permease protein UgpA n=1 Tax=Fluviispira multicolorata TaxID=2654512 RepID=A0A833JDK7_9BACT|nr:sn-glycerol-3-phosphate ABC transporter permease UgpA [Fluviispira multicolorata]KAB8030960.1 sn-glycerol-3-phosphate ABC transporter permease UgpA [Fluviispira multicolorata]